MNHECIATQPEEGSGGAESGCQEKELVLVSEVGRKRVASRVLRWYNIRWDGASYFHWEKQQVACNESKDA